MPKTIYFDGNKSVNIPVDFDSDFGWDVTGAMNKIKDPQLYAGVAAVFRAAHINADALASLPFALVDERGEEYDNSEAWENKVGFMPNPRELLRLWRLSLFATNQAYGYIDRTKRGGRTIQELRYIAPTTIHIQAGADGIEKFVRRLAGQKDITWRPDDPRLFYALRRDFDTELLPSENTEFRACLNSAGIMFYADSFIRDFFARGGIKPTMLMVKGVPRPEDQVRLEKYWDKLIRGLTKVVGKVFNAESVDPVVIGAGADDLKDTALYRQAIENVAMATGIPLSLLLANSANYATAQAEYASWFRDSVVPWAEFVADSMNERIFERMGLTMEFRPEAAEPGQEEEVRRAQAARTYYDILAAGGYPQPMKLAFQIVGVDLPQDVDIETLDVAREQAQPIPRTSSGPVIPAEQQPEAEQAEAAPAVRAALTFEQFEEMKVWRDKAFRALKNDKPQPIDFDVQTIPAPLAADIRVKLAGVKGERDIRAAFEIEPEQAAQPAELLTLAEALNRLAEAQATKAVPMPAPQPITVNLTAQMPEPGQPAINVNVPEVKQAPPAITVNVPEQPAPVVTVVNEVQPAPVENNITVQPADVVITPPKRAKVKRDMSGKITGLEAE
jgi:hypothetical protein